MTYLEQTIQRHTATVVASESAGPADYAAVMRAGIMLADHRAELEAWCALLNFWEQRHQRQPKEISIQLGVFLIAGYGALVLAILVYLIALAGH